jgi:AcrR family transcriptional regulator
MTKAVKSRPYASPLRQEQAAQTRARILDAARALFERDGFARTTVKSIAAAAKVAPDTVYATFGTKVRVLTGLIDRELTASADAASVTDRPEAHAVRDELNQLEQLHLFARDIATVLDRVRPVYEILHNAAAVDAELLAVTQEMDNNRLKQLRTIAGWLAARGPLRVDVERASEIIWAIASPDVARMLCDGRGWTVDDYARWLEDTLVRTLLD